MKILEKLENQPFDKQNQTKYQILLIQNKLYKPTNIPQQYQALFDQPELQIDYSVAEEIFHLQKYEDPPMRGRQSVNPLNKLGFCIARENAGNIKITQLGKMFLSENVDIDYVFLKSLLKLQFPNPWSTDFSQKYGFDIRPFIATLKLIYDIDNLNTQKGLSQTEFSLFIPSLINYQQIDFYIQKILEYRSHKDKKQFIYNFASDFYKNNTPTLTQLKNFFEYGDNIMRYFRLTKYFRTVSDKFGQNWYIDIEPTRSKEIEFIISNYTPQSLKFTNTEDYLNYIADITQPEILSESKENLKDIVFHLIFSIRDFIDKNNLNIETTTKTFLETDFLTLSYDEQKLFIEKLRKFLLDLKQKQETIRLKNDDEKTYEIIQTLKDYKTLKKLEPVKFEKIIADTLFLLNDEIKIKPNYIVDDNNEPISHAIGNSADIECFYETYNSICEVTLDTSNFQWIRETQPVMRHLENFQNINKDKISYCVFISPKLHIDTIYHFWFAIKYGYNNNNLKIIPLTTADFSEILETFLELKHKQKKLKHQQLKNLFDDIIDFTKNVNSHNLWLSSIPAIIKKWKNQILKDEN